MKFNDKNQNSLMYIQNIDQTEKYNLPSNNASSINKLNPMTTLTLTDLKKLNLEKKNKTIIYSYFYLYYKKNKKKNNNINKILLFI